jgi:hypothetical protein
VPYPTDPSRINWRCKSGRAQTIKSVVDTALLETITKHLSAHPEGQTRQEILDALKDTACSPTVWKALQILKKRKEIAFDNSMAPLIRLAHNNA